MAPAAAAKVSRPEAKGVRPKASWNINGRRKGSAPMPMRKKPPPMAPARNVG